MKGHEGETAVDKKASTNLSDEATKQGNQTVEHLEAAMQSNDKAGFRGALDEVIAFRASHTKEEFDTYMKSIREKAKNDDALPQLQIFATKTDFETLDTGNDFVHRSERENAKINNPLEAELVKGLEDKSSMGVSRFGLDERMQAARELAAERSNLRDLLKPGENGTPSLYDKVKGGDGSVDLETVNSFINIAKVNPKALNLSDRDKQVLDWLKGQTDGVFSNTLKQEELAKLCKDKNLTMDELQKRPTEKKNLTETIPKSEAGSRTASTSEAHPETAPKLKESPKSEASPKTELVPKPESAPKKGVEKVDRVGKNSPDLKEGFKTPSVEELKVTNPTKEKNIIIKGDEGTPVPAVEAPTGGKAAAAHGESAVHKASKAAPHGDAAAHKAADATVKDSVAAGQSKATVERKVESEKQIKEALTIKKNESYAHCAERLLALAGEKDPTAKQIRELSRQLWIADHRRKAGTLNSGQVLNMDEHVRKNPSLKKLFSA